MSPTALVKEPGSYWVRIGSRYPLRGSGPILFVVRTPTSGTNSKNLRIMFVEQVTIPDGTVKGPEISFPKNSFFKVSDNQVRNCD